MSDSASDTEVPQRVIKKPLGHDPEDPNLRSRWFVFTWYKEGVPTLLNTMGYIAWGEETCPTTGRRHLQGWVYFLNPRYTFGVRKTMGCWAQKMYGSIDDNDAYCSKQSSLVELGHKPKQGERTDLREITEKLRAGTTTCDSIALDLPVVYHQYGRTLQRIEDLVNRQKWRTEMTRGIWYYGETGTGKSHRAFTDFTPETHYRVPRDGGWWDGYSGQKIVIFNEFRGEIPFSELLELLDKWPYSVRRRGREPTPFLAELVIFTSPLRPEEIYKDNITSRDHIAQLLRRLDVVKCDTLDNL